MKNLPEFSAYMEELLGDSEDFIAIQKKAIGLVEDIARIRGIDKTIPANHYAIGFSISLLENYHEWLRKQLEE